MSDLKTYIIKGSIVNLMVSFILSVCSADLVGVYDIYILWTTILGFFVSWIVTLLIPANKINNFIAKLLKIKPDTLLSGLVGGLVTNLYFSPILTFSCKFLVFAPDFNMVIDQFIQYAGIMYIVSYFTFQICFNLTNYFFDRHGKKKNK